MMMTRILVDLLWTSHVKKMLLYLQKTHRYLYYFVLAGKGDGGNVHKSRPQEA